jgi:hypothetical protein
MFGLPILRRPTPVRVEKPNCKGAIYGCDDKEQPKLKSASNFVLSAFYYFLFFC